MASFPQHGEEPTPLSRTISDDIVPGWLNEAAMAVAEGAQDSREAQIALSQAEAEAAAAAKAVSEAREALRAEKARIKAEGICRTSRAQVESSQAPLMDVDRGAAHLAAELEAARRVVEAGATASNATAVTQAEAALAHAASAQTGLRVAREATDRKSVV